MRNRIVDGLNGYVLSPFGAVDMNTPDYGWGGSSAVPNQTAPAFDINNLVTTIGNVGTGILGLFGVGPTAQPGQPNALSVSDQIALANAQAQQNSAKNLPLYIGGGAAALLLLVLLTKK